MREFVIGDKVLFRNLGSEWNLGIVTERTGPVTYNIKINDRVILKHVDQIVKYYDNSPIKDISLAPIPQNSSQLPLLSEIIKPTFNATNDNKVNVENSIENPIVSPNINPIASPM